MTTPHKWQHLIDAQAAGKVCQMQGEDGTWGEPQYMNFDSPDRQYRLVPKTVKFRNCLWRSSDGSLKVSTCNHPSDVPLSFVQWVGDWQEVELPST